MGTRRFLPQPILDGVAEAARATSRLTFGATIVLSAFRARIELGARPSPPVYGDFTDLMLFWSDVALLLTLSLWLLSLVARPRRVSLRPRFLVWPAVGLVLVAWLGVPVSIDPALAAYQATRLTLLILFAAYVLEEVRDARLLVPIGAMVAVQAVVGLAQVVVQRSVGLAGLGELNLAPNLPVSVVTAADGARTLRAYGLTDHPNILGGLLAFALLLVAGVFVRSAHRGSRRLRVTCLALFALAAAGLFATFSRGAWLALVAGLAVLALVLVRQHGRRAVRPLIVIVLAGALAVAPLAIAFLPEIEARSGISSPVATEVRSIQERGAVAAATVSVIASHPLLGVGIGTLPLAIQAAQPRFPYDYQPASVVLLVAAAETGFVGALLYLALIGGPWIALVRLRARWTPGLGVISAALAAVTVVGLFDYYTWTYQPGRIWAWLVLGLWAAAYRTTAARAAGQPAVGDPAGRARTAAAAGADGRDRAS